MKEATGEGSMTVITIVAIAAVAVVGTVIVGFMMTKTRTTANDISDNAKIDLNCDSMVYENGTYQCKEPAKK